MKTLTSRTSPLRLDRITPEGAAGWVALTIAPGKRTTGTNVRWRRSLAVDLDGLVERGTTTLVPLLTDEELERLEIPELVPQAQRRGLEVVRFPFHDGCVPRHVDATRDFVRDLCKRFERGERLVIHCNGGLGRAGTIGACLRLELGLDTEADAAIDAVRGARRNRRAVETLAQERFIARYSERIRGDASDESPRRENPPRESVACEEPPSELATRGHSRESAACERPPRESATRSDVDSGSATWGDPRQSAACEESPDTRALEDSFDGAWLGLAVGDALGAPHEFQSARAIAARWGRVVDMVAGGPWEAGEWTDDTALAIATARAYADAELDLDAAAATMVAWLETDPKDVGGLTRSALDAVRCGRATVREAGSVVLAERPGGAGNGSLMRAAATGLVRRVDDPRIVEESVLLSGITHADPRCLGACAAFNVVLSALVHERSNPREAMEIARRTAAGIDDEVDAILDRVLAADPPLHADAPIGYVLVCFERALISLRDSSSFEQGLIDVVSMGGDTDTNAAVAGALLGARFGKSAIPRRWLDALLRRHEVETALAGLKHFFMHDVGSPAPREDDPDERVGPALYRGEDTAVCEPLDTFSDAARLFPRRADRRVAATAKLLSVTLIGSTQYRATWKLGFERAPESIVAGVLDAGAKEFAPEGALADAFSRYHEAPDPRQLEGTARLEWWACRLIDTWVARLFETGALSPLGAWRKPAERM